MADAAIVLTGRNMTVVDDRRDYGETRYSTVGYLDGRMVFVIWTERNGVARIISMRHANARERKIYDPLLG